MPENKWLLGQSHEGSGLPSKLNVEGSRPFARFAGISWPNTTYVYLPALGSAAQETGKVVITTFLRVQEQHHARQQNPKDPFVPVAQAQWFGRCSA
jgi:hypothetical protein